ncbi:MAG: mercury resistance system transport protein MerF [Kiloniellales bacterium]|nr:mercury resistance system transport protein MerF [Kiloniellales bacterium]
MKDVTLLKIGSVGTVIAGVCCFTPALVLLLGMLGLSAWLAWLDRVLLPAFTLFLGLSVYAMLLILRRRSLKQDRAE